MKRPENLSYVQSEMSGEEGNKMNFIRAIHYNWQLLDMQLEKLRNKHQTYCDKPGAETEKILIKTEDSIHKLNHRVKYFMTSEAALDIDVKQALRDLVHEAEWRLKQFELALEGNNLSETDVKKRRDFSVRQK
jgi:hypothetical protein